METYGWQNSYFASNWLVYTLDKGKKNLNKNKKGLVDQNTTGWQIQASWPSAFMYELAMVSCWINQIQNLETNFQRIMHRNKTIELANKIHFGFVP